jgi:hypothetical protein
MTCSGLVTVNAGQPETLGGRSKAAQSFAGGNRCHEITTVPEFAAEFAKVFAMWADY